MGKIKKREVSSYNRTLTLSEDEKKEYYKGIKNIDSPKALGEVINTTLHQSCFSAIPFIPSGSIDLLILDPPYNMTKTFKSEGFSKLDLEGYSRWFDSWFSTLLKLLKPTSSVYVCGDWNSSSSIHFIIEKYLIVRNRITWEREKGRGAKTNWKNSSEDIWFCTVSKDFTFNVEDVKLKRRVIAPYKDTKGNPKDWEETEAGGFRLTYPSNLWTDVTVPFWSMPENTEHPTQKPEKLIAKLILASSNKGDIVLDPFLGSGTTSVVSKKLGRNYIGIEIDPFYCCLAEKRLKLVEENKSIQGYFGGVFWERNSLAAQK